MWLDYVIILAVETNLAAGLIPSCMYGHLGFRLLYYTFPLSKPPNSPSTHNSMHPHLFLSLLAGLQSAVSPHESHSLQLPRLHAARQDKVQWKGDVLCMPATCHLSIVLRIDP